MAKKPGKSENIIFRENPFKKYFNFFMTKMQKSVDKYFCMSTFRLLKFVIFYYKIISREGNLQKEEQNGKRDPV